MAWKGRYKICIHVKRANIAWNSNKNPFKNAILALSSGEVFFGRSFGGREPAVGEVVFNTSMSGYQEIITDPSYAAQLVCMTMPHIGIVGVNDRDKEASTIRAKSLIVRSLSRSQSSWRSELSLDQYCADGGLAGIDDIDTRTLTKLLRSKGSVNGCVMHGLDERKALKLARSCRPMAGNPLGAEAGTEKSYRWLEGAWRNKDTYATSKPSKLTVGVLDCGAKHAIMRELTACGLMVEVLPIGTSNAEIQARYDGLVVSNGPGDPEPLISTIALLEKLLQTRIPLLGICLGHQLLARACGARTVKMSFGHHGANHPVLCRKTGKVAITSQNHGFCVDAASMGKHLEITHISLFDQSVQGFRHRKAPALGFQGHPEASPGPHELKTMFTEFASMVRKNA